MNKPMNDALEELIKDYPTPAEALNELKTIKTVMLTGITGAGKDTIIGDILQGSDEFVRVVTSTTRQPRENSGIMEVEGREYYFLRQEQASQKMADGEYLEVALVHGRINGSLIAEYRRIANMHKIALTDINYEGVQKFLTFDMEALSVYVIIPPSFEVWLARLTKRQNGTIGDHDELLLRCKSAQIELDNALQQPDFIPIMNDVSLETAQKIIEYTQTNSSPSDDERAQAKKVILELNRSISDYIAQIEVRR
jgi:guanylate kinase